MKLLRGAAVLTFLAGASLLVVGYACSGGDKEEDFQEFDAQPTSTATSTITPTAVPSPTVTPTPFNGRIATMAIPRLGISNPIEEVGIKPNNELDTPHDATGAIGWYYIYDKPGFGKNAVFSAHVNYNGRNGPFARLHEAQEGDEVVIQMADGGPSYTYKVFRKQRYTVNNIPMGDLIWTPDRPANQEWVTLITCSCGPGRVYDPDGDGYGECLDRDVVVAMREL